MDSSFLPHRHFRKLWIPTVFNALNHSPVCESRFKFLVLYVWRYYEYFCQHASDNWGVGSASRPAFAASDCQKGRQELTKFLL